MDRDELESTKEELLDDNDDDLEFHITFPSPATAPSASEKGNPSPSSLRRVVGRGDPEPVVFLLGWSGCRDKELSEYSRVYEELGCATVRYTAPAEYLFLSPGKIPPLSRKLLELVPEMSLEGSPVLVHAFGNNGAAVYRHMSELAHSEGAEEEHVAVGRMLRGVVFDSAPGQRTAASFLAAASEALGAQGYSGPLRLALPVLLLLLSYFLRLVGFLSGLLTTSNSAGGGDKSSSSSTSPQLDQSASLWCYDYLAGGRDRSTTPCLFLHSAEDRAIPPEEVEAAAQARERAGAEVDRVCFDTGDHVRLMEAHREAYVAAIVSFVSKCLKQDGGGEQQQQQQGQHQSNEEEDKEAGKEGGQSQAGGEGEENQDQKKKRQ